MINIRKRLSNSKRVVVKVGTSTITYPNGRINLKRIERLSWVLTDLRNRGKDVVLVSSGAIGVGSVRLNFKQRPKEIKKKQAASAVGQAVLMQIYQNFFNEYNQTVAQILLTKEDVNNQERKENIVNTFETLFEMEIIPIINCNDAVSTFEIGFSDNDRLAAIVSSIINADLLIILTDTDALYDSDPKTNLNAKRVPFVEKVTDEIEKMAGTKGTEFSVGGMEAKIAAAKMCYEFGCDVAVALGEDPTIIHKIIDGEDVGTVFLGKQ